MTKYIMSCLLKGDKDRIDKLVNEYSDIIQKSNMIEAPDRNLDDSELLTDGSLSEVLNRSIRDNLDENDKELFKDYLTRKAENILEYKYNHWIPSIVQTSLHFRKEHCLETIDPIVNLVFDDDEIPDSWKELVEVLNKW